MCTGSSPARRGLRACLLADLELRDQLDHEAIFSFLGVLDLGVQLSPVSPARLYANSILACATWCFPMRPWTQTLGCLSECSRCLGSLSFTSFCCYGVLPTGVVIPSFWLAAKPPAPPRRSRDKLLFSGRSGPLKLRRVEPILSEVPYSVRVQRGPRGDRTVVVTPNNWHLTLTRRPTCSRYPRVLSAVISQLGGSWHHTVGFCGCCNRGFVFPCVSSVPVLESLVPKVDSRTADRTCHRGDSPSILLWFLWRYFCGRQVQWPVFEFLALN